MHFWPTYFLTKISKFHVNDFICIFLKYFFNLDRKNICGWTSKENIFWALLRVQKLIFIFDFEIFVLSIATDTLFGLTTHYNNIYIYIYTGTRRGHASRAISEFKDINIYIYTFLWIILIFKGFYWILLIFDDFHWILMLFGGFWCF